MPNPEIARLRFDAHRLTAKLDTPAEVVRYMGALQAQDYPASLWAIGTRTTSATVADIDAAVARREIARTWPMRGTLHWVPAEDLLWMVRLMAPRAVAKAAARTRQLEIDSEALSKARNLLERRLRGGGTITRPQAYAFLAENGLSPEGQRGIHILSLLAHEGTLCFGPHQGKQPAFVLAGEWLPKQSELAGSDAVAELARRYFRSHGPATVHDFAWWTGLTVADARAGLEAVSDDLDCMEIEGKTYWFAPAVPSKAKPRELFLLPGFDEYILGYTDRTAVLSPEQQKRLIPGKNGMFLSSVVNRDGAILGTWSRRTGKNSIAVTGEPFDGETLPSGFEAAARRYAEFVCLPLAT